MSDESESDALWGVIGDSAVFASELVITEVPRGLSRREPPARWRAGWDRLLGALRLVAVDRQLLEEAARLQPPSLRSLDAIHLASALSVATAVDGVLVYDRRLASACESHGMTVLSPGRP